MPKMKIPSVDEWVRRYVVSSVQSAVNLSRYWKEQGFNDSEAEGKALRQAMGMISSGYGRDLGKAKDSLLGLRYWCDTILSEIDPEETQISLLEELKKELNTRKSELQSRKTDAVESFRALEKLKGTGDASGMIVQFVPFGQDLARLLTAFNEYEKSSEELIRALWSDYGKEMGVLFGGSVSD